MEMEVEKLHDALSQSAVVSLQMHLLTCLAMCVRLAAFDSDKLEPT